jgi:hypothetical protein
MINCIPINVRLSYFYLAVGGGDIMAAIAPLGFFK